jgi:hypothetical protein
MKASVVRPVPTDANPSSNVVMLPIRRRSAGSTAPKRRKTRTKRARSPDTKFTREFSEMFIGSRQRWVWPHANLSEVDRLRDYRTFMHLLLTGVFTMRVPSNRCPAGLHETLFRKVLRFLEAFELGGKTGWPLTVENDPNRNEAKKVNAQTLLLAELDILQARLVEACALSRGGGDGSVKWPVRPNAD